MRQEIRREIPCEIIITDGEEIIRGRGCYYSCGHVLTAFHVVEGLENFEILRAFPNGKRTLIYKAEFTKSCNTDSHRDQTCIKLLGDTSLLGDGLQNQIAKANKNESVYFYTQTPDGKFKKQKSKIIEETLYEFIISVAGKH